ncbi:MAG TPA: hypothetical protein VM261_10540 [Kofleriaceae bacterium]|nr:hypothetical protein [Kofleriaceae bacterium]
MKRTMWIASALLTLGVSACEKSSSPAYAPSSPEMAATPTESTPETATSPDSEESTTPSTTGGDTMGGNTMGGIARTGEAGAAQAETCPITAETDAIASVDVPDGAALVFKTNDPAEKSELRQELTAIANTQNSIATQQTATTNETGSGINVGNSVSRGADTEGGTEGRTGFESPNNDERPGGWIASASETRAEETVQGVQLVFTTDSNVEGLRTEVRERAEELNQRCAMTTTR